MRMCHTCGYIVLVKVRGQRSELLKSWLACSYWALLTWPSEAAQLADLWHYIPACEPLSMKNMLTNSYLTFCVFVQNRTNILIRLPRAMEWIRLYVFSIPQNNVLFLASPTTFACVFYYAIFVIYTYK